jgi:hypothetical protein
MGIWLLLGTSMALGTAVTEVVIRLTGAWPPELPQHPVESEGAKMIQQSPLTGGQLPALGLSRWQTVNGDWPTVPIRRNVVWEKRRPAPPRKAAGSARRAATD